jgi:hypothetical protein
MPSNPLNRPLKKIKPSPKPVTDRQVQYLAQKKKDRKQVERTFAAITPHGEASESNEHLQDSAALHFTGLDNEDFQHVHIPDIFDDLTSSPEDDDDDSDWSDIEDFDYEVISSLKRVHHNRRRLLYELRWAQQSECMIPSFLRCRELTQNWSNRLCWDQDFKEPCSCPRNRQRIRWVDMVDLHSKFHDEIFTIECHPSN